MPAKCHFTVEERQVVRERLARLVKVGGLRKCDVAHGCGLSWLLVHRIVEKISLPSPFTILRIQEYVDRKEIHLGLRKAR